MSRFLPIGTIVLLNESDAGVYTIAGYLPQQAEGTVTDYFGVPYPLGLLGRSDYRCFSQKNIRQVIREGYCDESCGKFLEGLEEFEMNLTEAAEKMEGG